MIRCGKCGERHSSAAAVKACHEGNLFACHWAVEKPVGWTDEETGDAEWWTEVADCGAEAIATERGWTCEAGHEHVNMQTQHDEGWTYVEEYGEAMDVARAGVEPRTISGHVVLGPQSFERV
jgi:hypothetical protein